MQAVTRFGPELVRMDVNRPYSNQPEQDYFGQIATQREAAYTSTQTQFYRWFERDKTWKHTRPPDDFFVSNAPVLEGALKGNSPR